MSEDFDESILDNLVCPLTKGQLKYDIRNQELISDSASLAYPIKNGIAVMLVDEARKLN